MCRCFDGGPRTPPPTTPKVICLDTRCRNCGHIIEHTGNGGVAWKVKDATIRHTGSRQDRTWECRCKEHGATFHAHSPVEVITQQEVDEVLDSIHNPRCRHGVPLISKIGPPRQHNYCAECEKERD